MEREKVNETTIANKSWVIDGSHFDAFSIRISHAMNLVYLDFPSWISSRRGIKPAISHIDTAWWDLGTRASCD